MTPEYALVCLIVEQLFGIRFMSGIDDGKDAAIIRFDF